MPEHPADGRGVEASCFVADVQRQLRARHRRDGQGVVRLFDAAKAGDIETLVSLQNCDVHGIVLENKDAFKERAAAPHLAPLLHLHERAIFVLAQFDQPTLKIFQPRDERLTRRHSHPHGQRVDNESDHRLRAC